MISSEITIPVFTTADCKDKKILDTEGMRRDFETEMERVELEIKSESRRKK